MIRRPAAPVIDSETRPAPWRQHLSLLPLTGIIPSFVVATYSITQPWARARFLVVWGMSRSPGAATLVVVTLAGMIAASVTVAARGRRLYFAAAVHAVSGVVMCGVAWLAFRMVRDAGFKLLGVLPITTVRAARGLYLWVAASLLIVGLGLVELAVAEVQLRRSRARARAARARS